MPKISQDIKDLLDKESPKRRKWAVKLLYFLALVGLIAIIAGAVHSCGGYQDGQTVSVLETK
jgi:hypothetical protein